RREVQPLKELVGPVHKLAADYEIVRAVDDVVDAHQVPGTVERSAVPAQGGIDIQLLHILTRPAGNPLVGSKKRRHIKSQIDATGEVGQRTAQVGKDQHGIRESLKQPPIEELVAERVVSKGKERRVGVLSSW